MRTFKNIAKALIVAWVLVQSSSTLWAQEAAPFDGESVPGRVIEFGFKNADWEDVIDWFADQAGLSLGEVKSYPEGTFTLEDQKKYTPFEALDQLNFALGLQQPPYTIIRRNNELILIETTADIPDVMVPKVTAEELDERGNFEVVTCKFHLGILDINEVEADLRALVPTKYAKYTQVLPASNVFSARAPGEDLKNIRQTIESLTRAKKLTYKIYNLKHYDPEQFLMAARGPLNINPENNSRDDKTLSISVDPSSGRLFVHATPSAHEAFTEVVELLDVAPTESGVGPERVYIKSYAITTDPEMARKVVETQLDGTTATIGQNEITGAIVLRGTEAQHKIADEVIKTIQGESGSTKIVELQNASATSILEAINELLNISGMPSENSNAPRLLANPSQNYIVIHGTPQQIHNVSEMIAQLDQAQGRDPNRIRTNARIVELKPDKRDELLESLPDRWPSKGRKNSLRIIMPDEKVQEKLKNGRKTIIPKDASTSVKIPQRSTVRTVAYQQIVDSAEASSESDSVGSRYVPPPEVTSIPGADLTIKATPFGVLLESDDLDALDDLEDIFRALAEDDGIDQGLTIFYLKFRKAAFVKAELEQMFGLSSGSSGGDGGGGIMGGIVDNMAGEGTGDLLGGLLGGGSMSSSGGAIELSGDVMIGQSVPLNLLYVSGATSTDLDYIQDAIDLFDQASPPHKPELIGQSYSIPILHRSPQGVLDQVNMLMADYISGGPAGEGEKNGGGEAGINQMAKMMRGMAGGGGGGNQNTAATEEAPKVRIGLDEETGQLLVVGPEFIYLEILKFVESIDRPELSAPKSYEVLPAEYFSAGALEIIRMTFGPKILEERGDQAEYDANQQPGNGANGKPDQGATGESADSKQRQAGLEMLRNLSRQRGGNGANGGGGQRGGGGGNRGGGGQRGGGR